VASVLGNGTQMVSWIHIDDLCSMIIYAIENRNVDGIYNAVAPAPVTNKALTVSLAKTLYGKGFITAHVPQFVLKILMGERSIEVLKSATVSSEKIEKAGFKFRFGNIDEAIKNLLGK
jgi:NAD dependent epimerase/dehydratase family enzyme